jgi:hypothetical protein
MKVYTVEAVAKTKMVTYIEARSKEEALIKAETELVVWTADDLPTTLEIKRAR